MRFDLTKEYIEDNFIINTYNIYDRNRYCGKIAIKMINDVKGRRCLNSFINRMEK